MKSHKTQADMHFIRSQKKGRYFRTTQNRPIREEINL